MAVYSRGRATEKITLYGTDGAARGTLGTQPGERLVAIAVGGAHVVADVEVAGSGGAEAGTSARS